MTVTLIRHGQTDWNLEGKVQGRTDIPLNATGRDQAREAANFLKEYEWQGITSSPLSRARETAEIIAKLLSIPLLDPVADLMERDYGVAEGIPVAELRKRWPNREIPEGEPVTEFTERSLRTISRLHEIQEDGKVLAVTHGAYIRGIIAAITDLDFADVPSVKNAAITQLERKEGTWSVTKFNNENAPAELLKQNVEPTQGFPNMKTLKMTGNENAACTIDGVC